MANRSWATIKSSAFDFPVHFPFFLDEIRKDNPLVETSHDFFSLRFSLQFWYRWKEGNNSGITSKFEVDPSKRSRVRAERSRKVERKSGRTLEICSVAQSRFRPPPGARTWHVGLHVRICSMQDHRSRPLRFSLLFISFFFFSKSFLWLHQVEIYTPLAALCTDSLHSTPSIYLGHRKNARSTTKVTSRNLVNTPLKVQGVEEIDEKKKKKTVNIAVNALEEPTCAQRWEPWQTCRAPQVRPWASLMNEASSSSTQTIAQR